MLRSTFGWLLAVLEVVDDLVRGLACPYCLERQRDLARHVDVDHSGDDHVLRARP